MYRLSITKVVTNPNYDREAERQKEENRRYGRRFDETVAPVTSEDKALTVEITDEEFKIIKKAVLEIM